jgi:phytanoyl-CoA hydroxylase
MREDENRVPMPTTDPTDFASIKATYDRDGFIVIRRFLPESELSKLRDELDRYIRDVVPTLPSSAAFYQDRSRPETLKQMQHMEGDPYFRDYTRQARWCELAEVLVGESASCQAPEWFNKPPGTAHPTPPHQDNFYFSLRPPNVVTLWLALDEVDEENGCLRYVRGSHRAGVRPHAPSQVIGFSQGISDYGESDQSEEVAVHLQPGDMVAHHGDTIHRAEANRSSDRQRRAFAMVFKGKSCRRDEAAYQRYLEALHQQHAAQGVTS